MTFTMVPIQGTYTHLDGTPLPGTVVTFTPTAPMTNAGRTVTQLSATADGNGRVSLLLPAVDDSGTTPTGVVYRVVETHGQGAGRSYLLPVPAASAGAGITIGGRVFFDDVTVTDGHHLAFAGTAPTATAGAAAGTTPPAPVVSATAVDQRGTLTFGTGTTPGAGAQAAVVFARPFTSPVVTLTPGNAATAALGLYVTSVSGTGFMIACATAPAGSQAATTYAVSWHVLG
jgi:hypothetical protein